MDVSFLQILAFGLVAAAANVLGGLVLIPAGFKKRLRHVLKYLLALGAGFMLGVTFFEIVPRTIELWQTSHPGAEDGLAIPMMLLLAGYLLTQFFEHTIAPHFHLGEEHDDGDHARHGHADLEKPLIEASSAYTGIAGLLIHTFFDGISIAAASQLDMRVGFLVFVAVLLHKFPEGFTVGSMIMAAGKGPKEVMIATSLIGLTTLVGVVVYYLIGTNLGVSVAYALPLASGVTLYVAASDLIPEVNHHGGHRPLVSLSVFAGVAIFFGIHFAVHSLID